MVSNDAFGGKTRSGNAPGRASGERRFRSFAAIHYRAPWPAMTTAAVRPLGGSPKKIWPEVGFLVAADRLGALMNTSTCWPTNAGKYLSERVDRLEHPGVNPLGCVSCQRSLRQEVGFGGVARQLQS